jgi:heme exporter protein D
MVLLGMDLGPHWAPIIASYLLAVLVAAGLVAWVVIDNRALNRTLADLEARGLRRRSGPGAPEDTP